MLSKIIILFIFSSRVHSQLLGLNLGGLLGNSKTDQNKVTTAVPVTIAESSQNLTKNVCEPSKTVLTNGQKVCKGSLIFDDNFEGYFLDKSKWDVEQYIPIVKGPDYEFVSYENNDETYSINNGNLVITPVPLKDEANIRGILDIRNGCTSKLEEECFYEQTSSLILPPVKSAKITSKFAFTYGKIEVKAKLPRGDWLFPQIQLIPRRKEKKGLKIWIAYSRGNNNFIGPRKDEGSRLLFGGPVLEPMEPERSRYTRQRDSVEPYGNNTHTYALIWEPDLITLLFDGEEYGKIPIDEDDERFYPYSREFYISFGVGVGGVNDFPDNYISNPPKPWKNMDRQQFKNFFDARGTWIPTWRKRSARLQVDSVKIWAV